MVCFNAYVEDEKAQPALGYFFQVDFYKLLPCQLPHP